MAPSMSATPASRAILTPRRLLVPLILAFLVLAGSAMQYTSTTFDEPVFSAVGARGLRTGDFGLVKDHPRLPQYLFGIPLYLAGVNYPPEEVAREIVRDPEQVLGQSRMVLHQPE